MQSLRQPLQPLDLPYDGAPFSRWLNRDRPLIHGVWPASLPLWMAAFYVALFIIRPWEKLIPELGAVHFERLYAIAMLTAVLASGQLRVRMDRQTLAVLGYLGAVGLSAVFAWRSELAYYPFYVYTATVVFYFVLLSVIRTPYQLLFIVTCYIVAMGVYAAKAQWEFFVHGEHDTAMGIVRLVGIEHSFGGSNAVASSFVISLPLAFFLWSSREAITDGWPAGLRRLFGPSLLIYAGLAVSTIILTGSRAGMLSFVLFVGLLVMRGRGLERKALAVAAGVILLAVIWVAMPQEKKDRLRTVWNPDAGPKNAQQSAQGRIEGLRAGLTIAARFPVFGVGVGNFIPYRATYVDGVELSPHNIVGQVLGETGLVGGLAFSAMVAMIFVNHRAMRRLAHRRPDPRLQLLGRLTLACRDAAILLAFEGLFLHYAHRFQWLWFAVFCGLALEFGRKIRDEFARAEMEMEAAAV